MRLFVYAAGSLLSTALVVLACGCATTRLGALQSRETENRRQDAADDARPVSRPDSGEQASGTTAARNRATILPAGFEQPSTGSGEVTATTFPAAPRRISPDAAPLPASDSTREADEASSEPQPARAESPERLDKGTK